MKAQPTATALLYGFTLWLQSTSPAPHIYAEEKGIPFPPPSTISERKVDLRPWASLSNSSVDRCYLLWPSLERAQNHSVVGWSSGERHIHNTLHLWFSNKSSAEGDSITWVNRICFWHFNLWGFSIQNMTLWGLHGVFKSCSAESGKTFNTVIIYRVLCSYDLSMLILYPL